MNKKQLKQGIKAGTITEAAVMRASDDMPEMGWLLCLEELGNDEAQPLTNKAGQVLVFDCIDDAIAELAAAGFDGSVSVMWSMSCN